MKHLLIPAVMLKALDGFYVYSWHRDGEYLYVGQTCNLLARLGNHNIIGVAEAIQDGDALELQQCASAAEARQLERRLIEDQHPRYNLEWKPRKWGNELRITKKAKRSQRYRRL
jgi:excinuclease UvrABC nuclease subunit